jgi:hypothetical protein
VQAFVAVSVAGFGAAVVVPSQDALLAVVVEPADRSAVTAVRNAPSWSTSAEKLQAE